MRGVNPPEGDGMKKDDSSQFFDLMELMGNQINGKDVDVVVSVLALLIANAGCLGGLPSHSVVSYVERVVRGVYAENDTSNQIIH